MNHTAQIQAAAEKAARQPIAFEAHASVVETFRGQTIWEGVVSQFKGDTATVYAWAVESEDGEPQYVTVLGTPPINSPLAAVRAWLVSQARK